jgi:uncharacterized protein (TIGR00730 family)
MKRIAVYCGSRTGTDPVYADAARTLGRELVRRGIGLVFGGGHIGLMGVIADAVLAVGGEAIGVIPEELRGRELAHTGLSALHSVATMHDRKAMMAELADGFIALPGGFGTLDEMFEMLTWRQLGYHAKPCGFLNTAGYFSGLADFLSRCRDDDFLTDVHHDTVLWDADPVRLIDRLVL